LNKRAILTAGVVILFALSAASVFVSAMNAFSATPNQDNSSRDSITVEREIGPEKTYRWVPIDIRWYKDPGSYDVADRGGGCDFCIYDIH
jgi:hypothetical protein